MGVVVVVHGLKTVEKSHQIKSSQIKTNIVISSAGGYIWL